MKAKKILIVVDMQNDFIDGALGSKEAVTIVDKVAEKIKAAEDEGALVLFTRDTHGEDYMATEEGKNLPVPHCIERSAGWQISEKIPYPQNSRSFDKFTFGSMDLGSFLKELVSAPERVELVGLCTDICVLSNAVIAKAALPNAHIVVDAACCAGVSPASHDTALAAMKAIQVEIVNQVSEPWRNNWGVLINSLSPSSRVLTVPAALTNPRHSTAMPPVCRLAMDSQSPQIWAKFI